MKYIITITLLLGMLSISQAQFKDIPAGHWAEEAVWGMVNEGVLTGFPDGLYHGEEPVTRYQVAIMLSRALETQAREDIDDIWSQIMGTQKALNEARGEQELIQGKLEQQNQNLERLKELVSMSANQDSVKRLEREIERTRLELNAAAAEAKAERARYEESVGKLGQQALEEMSATLSEVIETQARHEARLRENTGTGQANAEALSKLGEDVTGVDTRVKALEAQEGQLSGTLGVSVGADGDQGKAGLDIDLETRYGDVSGYVGTQEQNLDLTVRGGGVDLKGLYSSNESGQTVAAGVQANLSPALRGTAVGGLGRDGEAIVGAYAEHLPFERDSVIQGLGFEGGGLLGGETFSLKSVYGAANYTLGSDAYFIKPGLDYRREEGIYQAIVPSIEGGYSFGRVALTGEARLGFVSGLDGQEGNILPEAEIGLRFSGGGFTELSLSSGLPGRGLLTTEDPLATENLDFGFSVGYVFELGGGQ